MCVCPIASLEWISNLSLTIQPSPPSMSSFTSVVSHNQQRRTSSLPLLSQFRFERTREQTKQNSLSVHTDGNREEDDDATITSPVVATKEATPPLTHRTRLRRSSSIPDMPVYDSEPPRHRPPTTDAQPSTMTVTYRDPEIGGSIVPHENIQTDEMYVEEHDGELVCCLYTIICNQSDTLTRSTLSTDTTHHDRRNSSRSFLSSRSLYSL